MMRFQSLEQMLTYYAKVTPNAPALIYERNKESESDITSQDQEKQEQLQHTGKTKTTCTYIQLSERVEQRARQLMLLRQNGRSCLGILTDGTIDCIIELLAANRVGFQIVMLDGNAAMGTLEQQILATDVDLLYGEEQQKKELSFLLSGGVKEGRDRILFFTSGTTSTAKAVTLTGYSLCQSAYNGGDKLPLQQGDTLLCLLPLSHVFGMVCGLLWGLACGAAVALGRGPRHYIDDFTYFRPNTVSVVPTLLAFTLKHQLLNPELKLVLVGAGDCPLPVLETAKAMGLRVSFGYGLTETSSGVAISVGTDPYAMEICEDDRIRLGEDGEILISAPTCMMQGYYKNPEQTAEVLEEGWLHTGDLGKLDQEGRLHITGRKKEILVMGDGTKIYLPEYEARLQQVLHTSELAVILQNERPCLLYYGTESKDRIWSGLESVMKDYPRSQQIAEILLLEEPLPRTATGKIKRWELMQRINENQRIVEGA